jgi:GNAT superfamily N-acetyltransferase
MTTQQLNSILPGQLLLTRGTPRDYRALERFHYRPKRPATWAGVWTIHYHEPPTRVGTSGGADILVCHRATGWGYSCPPRSRENARLVAVAVLSYPTVNSIARDRALGIGGWTPRRKLNFVNQNVRTLSRVIIHPQFRSLGLASALVRRVCEQCTTRYVEAFAVMGRVHPFFEKGGMIRQDCDDDAARSSSGPVYYLFDRGERRAPQVGLRPPPCSQRASL